MTKIPVCLSAVIGCLCANASTPTAFAQPRSSQALSPQLNRLLNDRQGQTVRAWVLFTDKGIKTQVAYDAALTDLAGTYHPRAIQRREKRRTAAGLFDVHDLPLMKAYVDQVLDTGATKRVESTWLNGISVLATEKQLRAIASLPFIRSVRPVRRSAKFEPQPVPAAPRGGTAFYGTAFPQLDQINVPAVHAAGFTGDGIVIGVLDTGFQRTHDAFNNPQQPINVLGEWDFVDNDPIASIEPGDPSQQHEHGTWILGLLAAYRPGEMMGAAYDASFLLAKTEDTTSEVPAEEDNYVAGLQWLEANGADIATSSLGYIDWYTQSDLDGQTAVTTIAVNIATANGLFCITGAGNDGHDSNALTSHLLAPSDALQVITCGAVDSAGNIAGFSADGPSADGRVKPELLARGVGTRTVSATGTSGYTSINGTSASTPLIASVVALLLQARPNWTVDQMREALTMSAGDFVANGTFDPLYVRGYGIVDAMAALNFGGPIEFAYPVGPKPIAFAQEGQPTTITVEIRTPAGDYLDAASGMLHYSTDPKAGFIDMPMNHIGGDLFEATIPAGTAGELIRYYASAATTFGGSWIDPLDAPDNTRVLIVGTSIHEEFTDNFQVERGWTIEDNPIVLNGSWIRVDPNGTFLNENYAQPEDDNPNGTGTHCFVTGQGPPGGAAGANDLDGGFTYLISPPLDLTSGESLINFSFWFFSDDGDDFLYVDISDNDGADWINVFALPHQGSRWNEMAFLPGDYIVPTSQVRLRFSSNDTPNNSITEAAIDDVMVEIITIAPHPAGDMDNNGDVDLDDVPGFISALLGIPLPPGNVDRSDMNNDSERNADDIQFFVSAVLGL